MPSLIHGHTNPGEDNEPNRTYRQCRHKYFVGGTKPHVIPEKIKVETVNQDRTQDKHQAVERQIPCDRVKKRCFSARKKDAADNQPYDHLRVDCYVHHAGSGVYAGNCNSFCRPNTHPEPATGTLSTTVDKVRSMRPNSGWNRDSGLWHATNRVAPRQMH